MSKYLNLLTGETVSLDSPFGAAMDS